jgi:hypothetical protein
MISNMKEMVNKIKHVKYFSIFLDCTRDTDCVE